MAPKINPRATKSIHSRAAPNPAMVWENRIRAASVATYHLLRRPSPGDELSLAERGQIDHDSAFRAILMPESLSIDSQHSSHTNDDIRPVHHPKYINDHESVVRNHGSIAPGNNDEHYATNDEVGVGHPTSINFHIQDLLGLGAALEVIHGEEISASIEEADLGVEDNPSHNKKSGPINDDDDP
ncbi:hypothetical protein LTR84_006947 [Exophiala bonariae]|uniref:Uncharacterized protein n=1 Tax=Exophiala bonariae TaxID=1690606 RepID=A0AAV9N2E5_9EURO|nr:hypothetical protein LTR84_006947 [Exophiala bonariae]